MTSQAGHEIATIPDMRLPPYVGTKEGGWWDTPGLPRNTVPPTDLKIHEVYREYVHQKTGTHHTGGITDDAVWKDRWRRLVNLTKLRYDYRRGAVSKDFVTIMYFLWEGIMVDKHNTKKSMVFMKVILKNYRTVKKAKDVLC